MQIFGLGTLTHPKPKPSLYRGMKRCRAAGVWGTALRDLGFRGSGLRVEVLEFKRLGFRA